MIDKNDVNTLDMFLCQGVIESNAGKAENNNLHFQRSGCDLLIYVNKKKISRIYCDDSTAGVDIFEIFKKGFYAGLYYSINKNGDCK